LSFSTLPRYFWSEPGRYMVLFSSFRPSPFLPPTSALSFSFDPLLENPSFFENLTPGGAVTKEVCLDTSDQESILLPVSFPLLLRFTPAPSLPGSLLSSLFPAPLDKKGIRDYSDFRLFSGSFFSAIFCRLSPLADFLVVKVFFVPVESLSFSQNVLPYFPCFDPLFVWRILFAMPISPTIRFPVFAPDSGSR